MFGHVVQSTNESIINVNNYSNGVYQLIIYFDDYQMIVPVIIQK